MSASVNCDFDSLTSNDDIVGCVFGYLPNIGAAALFLALFALLALTHAVLAIRARSLVGAGITLCCSLELVGFALRLSVRHSWNKSLYTAMLVLLITAASMLAIANYKLIGLVVRMASGIAPDTAVPGRLASSGFRLPLNLQVLLDPLQADGRLNPDFVARLFSILALVTVVLQIIGISDLTSDNASQSTLDEGQHLLIAGLALQLFTYGAFFAVTAYVWHSPSYTFRVHEWPSTRRLVVGMLVTMVLLTMRGIYRLIQYSAGTDSSVARTEAPYYTCDALLVFLVGLTFAVIDVSQTLNLAKEEAAQTDKGTVTVGAVPTYSTVSTANPVRGEQAV